tara:strand:- start:322 stop:1401 length:1080 start_codon:yes stop_codon:yes gene_type:complete
MSSAKIGIGTTAPTERLHVVDCGSGDWATRIEQQSPTGHGLIAEHAGSSGSYYGFAVYDGTNFDFVVTAAADAAVGTSVPHARFEVEKSSNTISQIHSKSDTCDTYAALRFKTANDGDADLYAKGAIYFIKNSASHGRGDMKFLVDTAADTGQPDPAADTKMTISGTNGNVGIGTDNPYTDLTVCGNILMGINTDADGVGFNCTVYPLTVTNDGSSHQAAGFYDCLTDSTERYSIYWYRYPSSVWGIVGSVSTTNAATSFNTSSDYRLKENETPITGALDSLNELKPYEFNFKTSPDVVSQGFFAHEVAEIVPQAITGEKDEVDDDNKIISQQIDTSHMVPLLVAAVQELSDKVDALAA